MNAAAPEPLDPGVVIRSRRYRFLLVAAAILGVFVSIASWCFLEAVHGLQVWVYEDLPGEIGFDTVPTWWPVPVLALAGLPIGFAIARLPGRGGHEPAEGIKTGTPTRPIELPGVVLASLASIGLGFVVGPEAPLIALGMGLAIFAVQRVKREAPDPVVAVLASAGAFAAISTIFGSPVIAAVVLIEAAGLGGPTMSLVLLPGLMAAGIGSLVFIGLGDTTGLSTDAWELTPPALPTVSGPSLSDFGWTVILAAAAALSVFVVVEIGRRTARVVGRRPLVVVPIAGVAVAALAIAFHETTDAPANAVLFSGETALGALFASSYAVSTLVALVVFKGLAWGISLGSARGGPAFPAIFLGGVAGLMTGHLPGFSEAQGVAVLMGAMCVATLRLPLTSVVIASFLTSSAGLGVTPLIIVGVVVAYVARELLSARFDTPRAVSAQSATAVQSA